MRRLATASGIALAALCGLHLWLGAALVPSIGFSKYPEAAALLLQGRLGSEAGGDYSPLYLLLNAALSPRAMRWLQALAGCGGLLAVHAFGARWFGRGAGLAGAAAFSLSGTALLYEAALEPDLLICALGAAALAALSRLHAAEGELTPKGRRVALLAAGLALGLMASLRPTGLLLGAAAAAWVGWKLRGAGARRALAGSGLLAAAVLLFGAAPPLWVRGLSAHPAAMMSAGAVFQMGNRPEGTGLGAQPPYLLKQAERQLQRYAAHELYRRFAEAAEGRALRPAEAEWYWARKALEFARRHPGAHARLLMRKAAFFLYGPEAHDIAELRRAESALGRLPLLRLDHLGLLALGGLALALIRRRPVGLPALFLLCALATGVAFYVVSRFRLAALPASCALAGWLVADLIVSLRQPARLLRWAPAGLIAVLASFVPGAVGDAARFLARTSQTSELMQPLRSSLATGDLAQAGSTFALAQAIQPFVVHTQNLRGIPFESEELAEQSAHLAAERWGADGDTDALLLAVLADRAGRCGEALETVRGLGGPAFRTAVFDLALDPALWAAECLLRRGDREGAMSEVLRSLEERPGTLQGLASAVAGSEATGRPAEAWRGELFALHDALSARYALARARLQWGDAAGALADAEATLALSPELALAHYQRAVALVRLGRTAEGLEAYARALRGFPAFAFPTRPFDRAVRAELDAGAGDPLLLSLAIEHFIRAGRLEEAEALLPAALRLPLRAPELEEQLGFLSRARSRRALAPGGG
ncbi:MAG: hypothetical protein HYZ28_01695 [Myxococcales bacterium]|nr:hypothetical protein [Myxococcales bacterium]